MHTHNTSSVTLYADFNLALSSTLWVTACHHHGSSLYQGGPLHHWEAALSLCGHPASSDLQAYEGKQDRFVHMNLSHLPYSFLSKHNSGILYATVDT